MDQDDNDVFIAFMVGVFAGAIVMFVLSVAAYYFSEEQQQRFLDPNTEIVFGDPTTPCHVKQTLEEHLLLIDFDKTMSPKINALYMAWPYICVESEGVFEEAEQQ